MLRSPSPGLTVPLISAPARVRRRARPVRLVSSVSAENLIRAARPGDIRELCR